jgi:hypothetical protein
MFDPAGMSAYELGGRVQRLRVTLGERRTHLDREVLREVLQRAGEREGVVEALLDRTPAGRAVERNRLLKAAAEAALAYLPAAEARLDTREAGGRLDAAL